jgi:hypothetical protein
MDFPFFRFDIHLYILFTTNNYMQAKFKENISEIVFAIKVLQKSFLTIFGELLVSFNRENIKYRRIKKKTIEKEVIE